MVFMAFLLSATVRTLLRTAILMNPFVFERLFITTLGTLLVTFTFINCKLMVRCAIASAILAYPIAFPLNREKLLFPFANEAILFAKMFYRLLFFTFLAFEVFPLMLLVPCPSTDSAFTASPVVLFVSLPAADGTFTSFPVMVFISYATTAFACTPFPIMTKYTAQIYPTQ